MKMGKRQRFQRMS